MTKLTIKPKEIPALKSFEEVDKAIFNMAKYETSIEVKEAQLNKELLLIKNKYETDINKLQKEYEIQKKAITKFCKKHKRHFSEIRSKDLNYGRVGFRMNKKSLVQLPGWNKQRIIEALKNFKNLKYLKVKFTIKKQDITEDYNNNKITDDQLKQIGYKAKQTESFYIDINWDKIKMIDWN